eukprot:9628026-Alexandrium_andersonii.AAC.1
MQRQALQRATPCPLSPCRLATLVRGRGGGLLTVRSRGALVGRLFLRLSQEWRVLVVREGLFLGVLRLLLLVPL